MTRITFFVSLVTVSYALPSASFAERTSGKLALRNVNTRAVQGFQGDLSRKSKSFSRFQTKKRVPSLHLKTDKLPVPASTLTPFAPYSPKPPTLRQKLLQFRRNNRGVLAEFLGTFTLMFLGTGVNAVAGMGGINLVGVAIGWAFAIAMAVYVAGGVSEAHLNPAVTLTFAMFKGFPWKKVIPFMIAQMLGAFAGSGLAFLDHKSGLDAMDAANGVVRATTGVGATAGIFTTFPASHVSTAHAFFDEVLTTASLLMCVFAIGDNKNLAPKGNIGPLLVGGLVALLILGFAGVSGVAMNPARDLAPRVMTYLAGWGPEVFTAFNNYWWVPIVAPLVGAPLGGAVYSTFIDNTQDDKKPDGFN